MTHSVTRLTVRIGQTTKGRAATSASLTRGVGTTKRRPSTRTSLTRGVGTTKQRPPTRTFTHQRCWNVQTRRSLSRLCGRSSPSEVLPGRRRSHNSRGNGERSGSVVWPSTKVQQGARLRASYWRWWQCGSSRFSDSLRHTKLAEKKKKKKKKKLDDRKNCLRCTN